MALPLWGTSSFGRALPWHGRGEEFESPVLHHFLLLRNFLYILVIFNILFMLKWGHERWGFW